MSHRTLAEIASCLAGYDPDALPVAQAQQIIHGFVQPIKDVERVTILESLQRVLAADVISPINVPAHDNSAMDGYALRGSDLHLDTPTRLKVIGTRHAGETVRAHLEQGECLRIMTGAVMPSDCDTVVPQEFVELSENGTITIPPGMLMPGDNRRLRGEDLQEGSSALSKGRILRPADMGLLASLGIMEVPVMRRLKVAVISTGDELRSLGEKLDEGSVYDSNRFTLRGMLTRLGCDIVDVGIVRDDPKQLEGAFRRACRGADAIISSGGVSVGEADYTKQVMASLGDMNFWKIGMRPGRPMAFGRIRDGEDSAVLFGLPGNPVAVMVTFYFFVRDALLRMMGASHEPLLRVRVRSQSTVRKKAGRTEYQRGILSRDADGNLQVRITGSQGSGILRSMSEANCMIVLSHDSGSINAGDLVDVVLFDGLI